MRPQLGAVFGGYHEEEFCRIDDHLRSDENNQNLPKTTFIIESLCLHNDLRRLAQNVATGFRSPLRVGYVTVSQLISEGTAIGTIMLGGSIFKVCVANRPIPRKMITQDEAVAIARARAMEKGWGLVDPIGVIQRRGWSGKIKSYRVESNPALLGTRTRFTIDASSGAALEEGYIPR